MARNTFAIPASAPVANPAGVLDQPAPAIVANTPRTLAEVSNAELETRARKKMRETNPASVTNLEVAQSVARENAVMAEVAAGLL